MQRLVDILNKDCSTQTKASVYRLFFPLFLTLIRRLSSTMNSRVANILLPIVAVIVYVGIDLLYIFFARVRYEAIVVDIQKGERVELDLAAAIACYVCKCGRRIQRTMRTVVF